MAAAAEGGEYLGAGHARGKGVVTIRPTTSGMATVLAVCRTSGIKRPGQSAPGAQVGGIERVWLALPIPPPELPATMHGTGDHH